MVRKSELLRWGQILCLVGGLIMVILGIAALVGYTIAIIGFHFYSVGGIAGAIVTIILGLVSMYLQKEVKLAKEGMAVLLAIILIVIGFIGGTIGGILVIIGGILLLLAAVV